MHQTQTQIRFIFKSLDKDYRMTVKEYPSVEQLVEWVQAERVQIEKQSHLKNVKAFIKKQSAHPATSQYIKLTNRQFLEFQLQRRSSLITVEFFNTTKKESISMQLNKIGNDLEQRQRELRLMVNELKDEATQFYAMQIINKLSSSRSAIQIEHVVHVFLLVSDPLVSVDGPQPSPIYHDQVNVASHIDRLRRASTSYANLTIKAKMCCATRKTYVSVLNEESNGKEIKIVQFLTEVRRINGKLMVSFQGKLGQRIWQPAEEMLSYSKVDLLIVIGIGAYLLQEIDYPRPLILLTSISLQDKRTVTQYRNILQSYNAYNDTFSQTFLESFFQNLFKRIQIGESVDLAKRQSNKLVEKYIWCCCMHQHAEGCPWVQIVEKIGHLQAHRLFKHTLEDYKKDNFYECTFEIQQFLLGGGETCGSGSICCFEKMGENKLGLHKQVDKILYWNKKCSQLLYEALDEDEGKLNKFQSEEYDKPTGRKHPLSIFRLLQAVTNKEEGVLVLKSASLSTAKRYLNWAKEYLQARDKQTYFCQLAITNESEIKNYLKEVLKKLKSKSKLGANTNLKIKFFLEVTHSLDRTDKYYYKLLKDYPADLLSLAKVIGLEMERVKIVLLTCNPNFDVLYPLFRVEDCQQSELCHDVFSKYTYDYIRGNLSTIKCQIKKEKVVKEDIERKCEDMLFQNYNQYIFLGFVSLFSEDGFYLTNYGRIITLNLFGKEMLDKTADHTLPIETITLSDCVYLQLNKNYLTHFTSIDNGHKNEFQKKQLQYYYLLYRTYSELVLDSSGVVPAVKKEGLFSIDIMLQDSTYNQLAEMCKKSIRQAGGAQNLFDHSHFRHLYHLNQTEKIIHNFTRRKKNQYVASSKSFIRQAEPYVCTYLFWNVIHLGWRIVSTISHQFMDKVVNFQNVLLLFLIRVEISVPLAEIARLQLYSMIEKIPPKPEETIKCTKEMNKLLNFLRTYAIQQYNLSQMELSWGQTIKLKELICNCVNIAERIIDLLQKKETSDLGEELSQHKMFRNFTVLEWTGEILKLTQKKILYYFELSKMLKNMQSKSSWKQKEKQFNNQFKLLDLNREFRTLLSKMPEAYAQEKHIILIGHYLRILLDEEEVSSQIISDVKGHLSPEYLPLFDHLCQKIQQKTLFNQRGLIICARQRTILSQGRPYIMNRKRNLTMYFLKESLQKMSLKISYFTLNSNTLDNLKSNEGNNKCSMLFLILTIDSPNQKQLLFGEDYGISSELMDVSKFATKIKACRISVLIICGKNSIRMCEQLVQLLKDSQHLPNIIAIQNNKYSICDEPYNNYRQQMKDKGWEYVCNEVNQIAFDLLAIAIIANINNKLVYRPWTFKQEDLEQRVKKSLKMVQTVLAKYFECAEQVLSQVAFRIWPNHKLIDRVASGTLEDLTTKFYSSEHNLHDENFYENIGRCTQVNKIIESMVKEFQRCIEIIGTANTGKSTLLQEVCWISQTKNLFKFGVFKFNLAEDKDSSLISFEDFIKDRQFKSCQNYKPNQTSVLIALDNVDEQFIQTHKSILWGLKGKSVTIIFTTKKPLVGEALKEILECKSSLSINMNTITLNEVYGVLMSYIRVYRWSENHRFSKEVVAEYEAKVENIMKRVEATEDQNKLSRALELLKDISSRKEEERIALSLDFYRKNFEGLVKLIQNVKELKITII